MANKSKIKKTFFELKDCNNIIYKDQIKTLSYKLKKKLLYKLKKVDLL